MGSRDSQKPRPMTRKRARNMLVQPMIRTLTETARRETSVEVTCRAFWTRQEYTTLCARPVTSPVPTSRTLRRHL